MDPTELAKAYALQKTGLKWENLEKWTPAQRSAYLAANAEFRQQNPALFSPAQLAAAANYESAAAQRDPEFSYIRTFGSALADTIGERARQVAGIGDGVFNVAAMARWLLPAAALVAVVILLRDFAAAKPARALSRHFTRTRRHAR